MPLKTQNESNLIVFDSTRVAGSNDRQPNATEPAHAEVAPGQVTQTGPQSSQHGPDALNRISEKSKQSNDLKNYFKQIQIDMREESAKPTAGERIPSYQSAAPVQWPPLNPEKSREQNYQNFSIFQNKKALKGSGLDMKRNKSSFKSVDAQSANQNVVDEFEEDDYNFEKSPKISHQHPRRNFSLSKIFDFKIDRNDKKSEAAPAMKNSRSAKSTQISDQMNTYLQKKLLVTSQLLTSQTDNSLQINEVEKPPYALKD